MVVGERFKIFLMAMRQALIIAIGALEDYLDIDRSIIPRRKRSKEQIDKEE